MVKNTSSINVAASATVNEAAIINASSILEENTSMASVSPDLRNSSMKVVDAVN